VVIGLVIVVLIARTFIVPKDFGVQDRGYMYGFHRMGSEDYWKNQTVKYKTVSYCVNCHEDKVKVLGSSPHSIIQCENCHGPAGDHPENPATLPIDKSRKLCLRCHAQLPYPTSGRGVIAGIDPDKHNVFEDCIMCHNPHHPNLEDMR